MSEELLSAMLDGECSPAEMDQLLSEIESSPALKARWSRMCLTRSALADTRVRAVAPDFCAGVMAAIQQDQAASSSPKVVPLRRRAAAPVAVPASHAPASRAAERRADRQADRGRWQPVAGLAAAASIAAVAAVGGYRWLSQPLDGGNAVAALTPSAVSATPVATIQPVSASGDSGQARLVQVSASGAAAAEPVETRWSQLDADTVRQLNEFMMEHSNMRAQQGVGATLSYPRLVRTADYRSGGEPH